MARVNEPPASIDASAKLDVERMHARTTSDTCNDLL